MFGKPTKKKEEERKKRKGGIKSAHRNVCVLGRKRGTRIWNPSPNARKVHTGTSNRSSRKEILESMLVCKEEASNGYVVPLPRVGSLPRSDKLPALASLLRFSSLLACLSPIDLSFSFCRRDRHSCLTGYGIVCVWIQLGHRGFNLAVNSAC